MVTRSANTGRFAAAAVLAAGIAAVPPLAMADQAGPAGVPVLGQAATGGPVIVWLQDQHSDLNLRTQGAERTAAAHADQRPVVAAIKAAGGADIVQLVSVNAVAADVPAAAIRTLRGLPGVKEIIPDATFEVGDREPLGPLLRHATIKPDTVATRIAKRRAAASPSSATSDATAAANPFPGSNGCGTQSDPLVEPEALSLIHAPAMTNAGVATEPGHGVVVANDGLSEPPSFDLVGNPNLIRPASDGGGSVVLGATPGDNTDHSDGEYYGDASSIAAQGTVEYQYSHELPYAGLPDDCYFKIVGDAPGASLVDTGNIDTPESGAGEASPDIVSESQVIAGIDAAVIKEHADVINESYGYSPSPGSYAIHYAANDAAVQAGVTVVASSGDSGVTGTVSSPATDPEIIAVGATNSLRLMAMAYGFAGWVNNDITPLSSGGTSPNNRLVDLVAPGYGGEAACSPAGSDCPTNTQTQAFGGTSEAAPLVAGAAADVIAAYRDTHNGDSPSPALVKQILTGTATDVGAPADQQGAGLLNIGAAVSAATHMTNTTAADAGAGLVPTPTQLDLTGTGGSSSYQSVQLYNASSSTTTVTGSYRTLGPEQQLGSTVTENVSAPNPADAVPADGAQAAPNVTFDVPAGVDRLDADMIWPDADNGAILSFTLVDPEGRLRQISYDYGSSKTVPDIQHAEVANPEAGRWTAEIKWANGRGHLQSPPNAPGSYTGTVSFKTSTQNWVSSPVSGAVTIAAHRSATVPLTIPIPDAPGDHPAAVVFSGSNGVRMTVPIARRTLIPGSGGEFDDTMGSSTGRGLGGLTTYDVVVPEGQPDLGVTLTTPDTSADDPMTLFMVDPSGTSVATHVVNGRSVNGVPLSVQTVGGTQARTVTYHVPNPAAGVWEIDVRLDLTTSGQEFSQLVTGDVLPQAPTITAPSDGSRANTQTPRIAGTGTPGDTVTVADAGGTTVCTGVVDTNGDWACTAAAQPSGVVSLTATQADQTGDPSLPSAATSVTIPVPTISVRLSAARIGYGRPVTGSLAVAGASGGTASLRYDAVQRTVTLGSDGRATFVLPQTLAVGTHTVTATYSGAATTAPSTSASAQLVVTREKTHTVLKVAKRHRRGTPEHVKVTVQGRVGGLFPGGKVTVTVLKGHRHLKRTLNLHASAKGKLTAKMSLGALGKRPGVIRLSARYAGDARYAASTSPKRVVHVR